MTDALAQARKALEGGQVSLNAVERLRLHVEDPTTWEFCYDDAVELCAKIDSALAAIDAAGGAVPSAPAVEGVEPVVTQWRCRAVNRDRTKGPWEGWKDGRKPEFRGGTYEAEERHLYHASAISRLVKERDEARAEVERMTPQFVAYEYLEAPDRREVAEDEAARLTALLAEADAERTRQEERVRVLEELAKHANWELDFGPFDESNENDDYGWRVHSVNGGRNDREWTLIGFGDTPEKALRAALGNGGGDA